MGKDFFNADMQLFLNSRVEWERYFQLRRGEAGSVADELETYRSVLQTLDEICKDIAANAREHWDEEVQLADGRVVTPPHIGAGYEKLRKAGLVCLPLSSEYDGYGLPLLLNIFYLEMIARADSSLMTIVGLQTGVASDIEKYGSDELKKQYLPRFTSGELQGCMDLTESQAGSDLGGIVTRMTEENGRFFLDGEKIFITNGGAAVHLVLARDAKSYEKSKGTTNGLSLLLCPTVLPDGSANQVRVARVEHKMGIHGSPTCVIEFDHAEGFLLGRRGGGFRAILDLMNNARLGVAAQAIGVAEAAYREAREYAGQRVQFGAPILEQPLVKSLLTQMVLNIRAARALLYRTCALIDVNEALRVYLASERGVADPNRATLEDECQRNQALVRFLTPLCKYYATEISNDVTRKGIQVHGGIGYMAESPAAHY
ncbi:MAG: acyl-CoA dehydrogenase family protein, partial [Deltaproteobacteria bacterium]|nr:acyl-CoA dehydrogenase family protein [Deltaproteobacteria bacterium]